MYQLESDTETTTSFTVTVALVISVPAVELHFILLLLATTVKSVQAFPPTVAVVFPTTKGVVTGGREE